MRFTQLKSFICGLSIGCHPALACEIELVIAMDVSRSVDQYEFDLMRSGTANAFIHPEIIDMINLDARRDCGQPDPMDRSRQTTRYAAVAAFAR